MFCPTCGKSNPVDAQFCIFCATRLEPVVVDSVPQNPVTGPTVRLDAPSTQTPSTSNAPQHPQSSQQPQRRSKSDWSGLFFIGLGLLFLTGTFWPGILLLIGLMAFINHGGRHRDGLQGLLFFGGLAFLFATGLWWPGILVWLGVMSLIGSPRHGWRCW